MADTRTFRNFAESLAIGPSQYLVGANERRVPSNSQGLPAGGTTGQAMIKLSDEDYDAGWTGAFIQAVVAGSGITIDNTDPRNPIISADASSAVTSVGMSVPTGFAVAGSPITSTGTFAVTYAAGYQGYTSSEATKLSGISAGADVTAAALLGLPTKPTPVDADYFGIIDSAASNALKALSWANVKATLKTYFDTLYGALATANQWTKPQRASATALTSAGTITPNLADTNDFTLTLDTNATLANPTNQSTYVGQKGSISCVQDGTGGHTLAFGANWFPIGAATAPAAPTGPNAKFRIDFHVVSSTRIDFKLSSVGV